MELTDLSLGYNESGRKGFEKIENGEFIDAIIINEGYDTGYLRELEAENALNREKAEALNKTFELKLPSAKEGGISIDYAVIRRSTDGVNWKYCFGVDEWKEPGYVVYGRINQLTPRQIYQKRIANMIYIPTNTLVNNNIELKQIYPRVYPAAHWQKTPGQAKSEKIFDAEDIPKQYLDTAEALKVLQAEQERKLAWEGVLAEWDKLSEDQGTMYLQNLLGRRLLLAEKANDKELIFHKPKVGTVFRAQVNRYKDSKYLDIRTYDSDWGKATSLFSNLQVNWTEENEAMAKEILKIKLENIKKRAESKTSYEEEDNVPF